MGLSAAEFALEGVTKQWPGAPGRVLDDLDLRLEPGTATLVCGANGAGKTTLLRVAAGLVMPERGRVRLGDLDVLQGPRSFRRRVGVLSAASAGLYARLTVHEHLRLWARLALLRRHEGRRSCERALQALELEPFAGQRVDRLSMGQRQRVRLAGAFLHDPAVAMLDEPANSLDEEGIALLGREVERLRQRGGIVLWCAPSADVERFGFDRRLTIAGGRLTPG
jgi:ABC-type multidrug transport system ATPase subunit